MYNLKGAIQIEEIKEDHKQIRSIIFIKSASSKINFISMKKDDKKE